MRLYPLFHPAAALRTPAVKEQLREDFARLPALLAEALPARARRRPRERPRAEDQSRGSPRTSWACFGGDHVETQPGARPRRPGAELAGAAAGPATSCW